MWGEIYRRTDAVLRDPRVTEAELERLIEWLGGSTLPVLDAGCGSGAHFLPLLALGFDVHGVDLDVGNWPVRIGFCQAGKLEALSHPPETFSHVYCLNNTAFFGSDENTLKVLAEFHRVLAPGGKILLHQSNIETVAAQLPVPWEGTFRGSCVFTERDAFSDDTRRLSIRRTLEGKTGECVIQLYRREEWAPLLESCGFSVDRIDVEPAMVWVYATKA